MDQERELAAGRSRTVFATTVAASMEAFINPVARELERRGHSIHLVSGDRHPTADFDHTSSAIPMERGISPRLDPISLREWVAFLRSTRPEMVVAGTPKASLLSMTAAQLAGVPSRVYVIHGAVWDGATGVRRRVLESAERRTIAASTTQIAVSDSLARLVSARGLSRSLPLVVGSGSMCGVDTQHFRPTEIGANRRPSILFVGRLNRDKGIDVLLRTLDRIRANVDASLTVVGSLDESAPPDESTMRQLTAHPHVSWVGRSSNPVKYYQSADLLLFPSHREGLPQVPLEAQACGVPVVSWRVTGVVDAVRDGFTGTLVAHGDEEALARAAIRLLQDPDERSRMSPNARLWAEARFRRDDVVERNAEFLERLLTKGLRHAG